MGPTAIHFFPTSPSDKVGTIQRKLLRKNDTHKSRSVPSLSHRRVPFFPHKSHLGCHRGPTGSRFAHTSPIWVVTASHFLLTGPPTGPVFCQPGPQSGSTGSHFCHTSPIWVVTGSHFFASRVPFGSHRVPPGPSRVPSGSHRVPFF